MGIKKGEIDDLFIEYLVPVMDYFYHTALIEEWKQNIDAAAYEKNLNQDAKIPSIKKNYCNEKTENLPTIIK